MTPNTSVPWMSWVVICDTPLSGGRNREVFASDDDCLSASDPYEDSPMARAIRFARFHENECRAEVPNEMLSGTVEVFCSLYRDETRHVIYLSDPTT